MCLIGYEVIYDEKDFDACSMKPFIEAISPALLVYGVAFDTSKPLNTYGNYSDKNHPHLAYDNEIISKIPSNYKSREKLQSYNLVHATSRQTLDLSIEIHKVHSESRCTVKLSFEGEESEIEVFKEAAHSAFDNLGKKPSRITYKRIGFFVDFQACSMKSVIEAISPLLPVYGVGTADLSGFKRYEKFYFGDWHHAHLRYYYMGRSYQPWFDEDPEAWETLQSIGFVHTVSGEKLELSIEILTGCTGAHPRVEMSFDGEVSEVEMFKETIEHALENCRKKPA